MPINKSFNMIFTGKDNKKINIGGYRTANVR